MHAFAISDGSPKPNGCRSAYHLKKLSCSMPLWFNIDDGTKPGWIQFTLIFCFETSKAIALANDKTVKEYTCELENNGDVYSYIHISDTFDIGNNGKFRLILVTTDSRGYIYENTLFGLSTNVSGTILNDGNSNEYYLTRVYDKDHNFLFDKEY